METPEEVNAVLAGYFSKLVLVLVSNKAQEVYRYVYSHPRVLDSMVNHLYQKSVAEVLQKLLNTSESLADDDSSSAASGGSLSGDFIDTIRQSFVYKIVQRMCEAGDIEVNLNAF